MWSFVAGCILCYAEKSVLFEFRILVSYIYWYKWKTSYLRQKDVYASNTQTCKYQRIDRVAIAHILQKMSGCPEQTFKNQVGTAAKMSSSHFRRLEDFKPVKTAVPNWSCNLGGSYMKTDFHDSCDKVSPGGALQSTYIRTKKERKQWTGDKDRGIK